MTAARAPGSGAPGSGAPGSGAGGVEGADPLPDDASSDEAAQSDAASRRFFGSHDSLVIRVLSGVVLGPTALAACYIGGPAFVGLTAFLAVAMTFEWTRMVAGRDPGAPFYVLAVFAAATMIAAAAGEYGVAYGAAFVGGAASGATFLFANNERARAEALWSKAAWTAVGALYIIAPSAALIWLREDVEGGRGLIFLLFAIVWSADSAAYLGGRLIGGPLLSPSLSPAKTWSGAACGVAAGGLVGFLAAERLLSGGAASGLGGGFAYALTGAALGLASILGDIVESAFKRIFQVKDISGFIPGHGGVLDRLDGMIFATASIAIVLYGQILFSAF